MAEITEADILEFTASGGMLPAEIDTFLNSKCYTMDLVIPAEVALDIIEQGLLTEKAVVVGCRERMPNLILSVWVPAPHKDEIIQGISTAFRAKDLEPPAEFYDFEAMDQAMTGREHVKALISVGHRESL